MKRLLLEQVSNVLSEAMHEKETGIVHDWKHYPIRIDRNPVVNSLDTDPKFTFEKKSLIFLRFTNDETLIDFGIIIVNIEIFCCCWTFTWSITEKSLEQITTADLLIRRLLCHSNCSNNTSACTESKRSSIDIRRRTSILKWIRFRSINSKINACVRNI